MNPYCTIHDPLRMRNFMNILSPEIISYSFSSFKASHCTLFAFDSCENSCGRSGRKRATKVARRVGQDFNKNFARSSRGGDER